MTDSSDGTPPINLPTASVREQTANLAELALQRSYSDTESRRRESSPMAPDTYLLSHTKSAGQANAALRGTSPDNFDNIVLTSSSHRQSMLTHLLKTSPSEIVESSPSDSRALELQRSSSRIASSPSHLVATSPSPMSETCALFPGNSRYPSYGASETYSHSPFDDDDEGQASLQQRDLERQFPHPRTWLYTTQKRLRRCWKTLDWKMSLKVGVLETLHCIPAVLLGLLLNILDALSYGMILFPLGQTIFEKLGPDGISMFYVSCIISQLVYSLGGSVFKGGVGSEMVLKYFYFSA